MPQLASMAARRVRRCIRLLLDFSPASATASLDDVSRTVFTSPARLAVTVAYGLWCGRKAVSSATRALRCALAR
eukprot:5983926-Prymnesium_polylepis.1